MRIHVAVVLALLVAACSKSHPPSQQVDAEKAVSVTVAPILDAPDAVDLHSYARPQEARVTHVALDLTTVQGYTHLSGDLDQVEVFNRELTPAEIVQFYGAPAAAVPATPGPVTATANTPTQVTLTFSFPVNAATFSSADLSLTGPLGAVVPLDLEPADATGLKWTVSFSAQSQPGTYTLKVGPNVADQAGNVLNQNQNGVGGEAGDAPAGDVFVANFEVDTFRITAATPTGPQAASERA